MSVTKISGSLGLRVGDGRVVTTLSSKKASLSVPSTQSSIPLAVANANNNISTNKMAVDNHSLAVPSQPPVITGMPGSTSLPTPANSDPVPVISKAYGTIVLTLENVLLPYDKIMPTPSALDGLDYETEMDLRIAGCELISSSGILLKLPQTAMATGQVLFQRFYYSKSFIRQPMEVTAMACIYLASKIEEAPRRIRDVINVFHHIKQLRAGKTIQPMILDPSYIRLKSDVTLAERRVLKELGFCVHVKHPHKLIVVYMQQLGYDKESNFVQMSWNYMSDALRSNVFVRYTPEAIACACIFLSARQLKIALPSNPAWYVVFDVEEEHIMDICEAILELYERPKVSYDQLEKKVDTLIKAYQDSRQKSKVASVADRIMQGTSNTASPSSRPASPTNTGNGGSIVNSVSSVAKNSLNVDKRDREKRKTDGSDHSGRKSAANSPEPKKPRRSPSPIVYSDSPQRHKKKKRRKSRSESSSPSRSRDRSSVKKHTRRERSRSPYSAKRQHHKKSKSHHRERYRSRSRSYSPADRDDNRYDRGYDKQYYNKKSSKSSKHPRDRDEESLSSKSRGRDKDRR